MPSQYVEVRGLIAAPIERVWSVMTDVDHFPEVSPTITAVEPITPGPYALGSRWRQTRSFVGKDETHLMTVTDAERPHRLVVEATTLDDSDYTLTVTLAAHDQGTHVVIAYAPTNPDASPAERLVRLLARAMSDIVYESALQRELDAFRAAAEESAASAPTRSWATATERDAPSA